MSVSTEAMELELAARKQAILDHQRKVCVSYANMTANQVADAKAESRRLHMEMVKLERSIQGWKRKGNGK